MAFKKFKVLLMKLGCMKLRARVLVLGLCNSGKTTVVRALAGHLADGVAPTMGYEVETTRLKRVKLTTFDMSGQPKYQTLWDHFYGEANGVVFVVDAADVATFPDARAVFSAVMSKVQPKRVPVLVLCNKMDMPNASHADAVAAALEVAHWSSSSGVPVRVLPCTAMRNQGLEEAMAWMTKSIRSSM